MHKTPTPSNGRQMAKILTTQGFTVTKNKRGHYKATHPQHPDKPAIRFASTPSDYRWARNTFT